MEASDSRDVLQQSLYVVALGPSLYVLHNYRKSPGNLLCPLHIYLRATPMHY